MMMERPPRPTVGSEEQGERANWVVDIAARQEGVGSEEQGSVPDTKGYQQERSKRY
jgi:hypothetical protein